jgi:hypothetical protein
MTPKPEPFHSPAVSAAVERIAPAIADEGLRRMFRQCVTNTLDSTVVFDDGAEPDTYVITGDIPAMWLRDSSAQVWPYLRFAGEDARLARMIRGLIARHARCILLDPYANAFLHDASAKGEHAADRTEMMPGVFERKFEVDSLCHALRLAHGYWAATRDASFATPEWRAAVRTVLDTWRVEQDHAGASQYRFERDGCPPTDTLQDGRGTPVARTGMVWSGFRPSDDRCEFHFLVPAQAFAVVSLQHLAELALTIGDLGLAQEAARFGAEIQAGIHAHARVRHPVHGDILAYEVDGLGNAVLGDDANVPSLLSLAYLGYFKTVSPLYQATRAFVLSRANPWFAAGRFGEGVGSPHTPEGRVWPMAVVVRAMTSPGDRETLACLRMLRDLAGDTGFMHESVDPDDPAVFSRAWFAWANSMFGELILDLAARRPALLAREL